MSSKHEDREAYVALYMEGETLPIAESEKMRWKNIQSGKIAEITQDDYILVLDNWYICKADGEIGNIQWSVRNLEEDGGVLVWYMTDQERCFARYLRGQEWYSFITL